MTVTITAELRPDGIVDFSKDGPGAFMSALYPSQLEAQLQCSNMYSDEREKFHSLLAAVGSASHSFSDRKHYFRI
jgi:hypothetical protein